MLETRNQASFSLTVRHFVWDEVKASSTLASSNTTAEMGRFSEKFHKLFYLDRYQGLRFLIKNEWSHGLKEEEY